MMRQLVLFGLLLCLTTTFPAKSWAAQTIETIKDSVRHDKGKSSGTPKHVNPAKIEKPEITILGGEMGDVEAEWAPLEITIRGMCWGDRGADIKEVYYPERRHEKVRNAKTGKWQCMEKDGSWASAWSGKMLPGGNGYCLAKEWADFWECGGLTSFEIFRFVKRGPCFEREGLHISNSGIDLSHFGEGEEYVYVSRDGKRLYWREVGRDLKGDIVELGLHVYDLGTLKELTPGRTWRDLKPGRVYAGLSKFESEFLTLRESFKLIGLGAWFRELGKVPSNER